MVKLKKKLYLKIKKIILNTGEVVYLKSTDFKKIVKL